MSDIERAPDTLRAAAATNPWHDGMQQAHAEAAGIFDVFVIGPESGPELLAAAILGDAHAAALLRAVTHAARQIDAAPRRKPALCLCCPRPIRDAAGTVFVVAEPHTDDASTAIGAALCGRCAAHSDLTAKVVDGFRRHLWPDARPVRVTHPEGGRA